MISLTRAYVLDFCIYHLPLLTRLQSWMSDETFDLASIGASLLPQLQRFTPSLTVQRAQVLSKVPLTWLTFLPVEQEENEKYVRSHGNSTVWHNMQCFKK